MTASGIGSPRPSGSPSSDSPCSASDLRRDELGTGEVLLRRGVSLLKQSEADVVLMDMQYAPRVVERRSYAAMEQLIAEIAHHTGVGLFRRFARMQHWRAAQQAESPRM